MKISKHLYALAIAGVFSTSAYAQTLLYSVTGTTSFDYWNASYPQAALAFSTTATHYTITDFDFYGYQSGGVSGNISFFIYSHNPSLGSPNSIVGSSLGTVDSNTSLGVGLGGAGNFGLSSLNVSLTPSTTYWLVADFSSVTWTTGQIYLCFNATGSPTPPATYKYTDTSAPGWTSGISGGYLTGSVTASSGSPSPVPEASGSVAGLGLAMAGLYQLRRRKAAGRAVES
jgi:hypothetical protein